jgi:hypothetical protein
MSADRYLRVARGVFKFLNAAWYLNLVLAVLLVVFLGVVALSGGPRWGYYGTELAIRDIKTTLPETDPPPETDKEYPARYEPRSAKIYLLARDGADVAAILFDFLTAALALAGLYRMRELFRNVARAEVFTLANATHIRWVAALLAAAAVVSGGGTYLQGVLALRHVDPAGTGLRPLVDWASMLDQVFGALITLLVAEAFRIGALLKRDADLTV